MDIIFFGSIFYSNKIVKSCFLTGKYIFFNFWFYLGSLDMLRAEENLALRAGVIAGGGLVGLLVGMMRGRFIKRLFYTRYMLFKSL